MNSDLLYVIYMLGKRGVTDLFLVPDVGIYDREELIVSLREIEGNNLFNVCAFAKTLCDEVLFHIFVGSLYLDSFLVEPLYVVSEGLTFPLDDGFEGRHCFLNHVIAPRLSVVAKTLHLTAPCTAQ